MSRNMIEAMGGIFRRLAAEVRSQGQEHTAPVSLDAARYIRGDDDDREALQRATIFFVERVPGYGAIALLRWRSRYIFSLPSQLRPALGPDEDATEMLRNAGLSCLLFGHAETELVVQDVAELVDAVFGDEGEYGISTVERFFTSYSHYWARASLDDAKASVAWSRCHALCARGIVAATTSRWMQGCKEQFEQACMSSAAGVAGAGLLSAAIASTWSHTYLEVYRVIETLFPVVCIEDLMSKLPPEAFSAPRAALLNALDESLQWKLRQDTTLARLVSRLPDAEASQIAVLLGVSRDRISKIVYDARNQIAHGALNASPIANQEGLLSACLLLACAAYDVVKIPDLWFEGS